MSGVRNRTRAVAIDRSERSQLHRVFVIALSTTLFTLMAALGLNAQQVETEKPTEELAMGSVSIDTPVTLKVRNHNWLEARIYAVHAGTRYRLGTVGTLQTETFQLPRVLQPHIQAIQFLTLPIGSTRGYLSPEILADPGDVVAFEIEENLNHSSLYIAGTTIPHN